MTISKGTHAPLRLPTLLWRPKVLAYMVRFDQSARYDIGADQSDINKLFGIGYLPHHFHNSVRIGWNWDEQKQRVVTWAYWYKDSLNYSEKLHEVRLNVTERYAIHFFPDRHTIMVPGKSMTIPIQPRTSGYLLGPYFGGNQTAPHDINLHMTPC